MSTNLLRAYMNEPYTFHLGKNISVLQRSMQEDTDQLNRYRIFNFLSNSSIVSNDNSANGIPTTDP